MLILEPMKNAMNIPANYQIIEHKGEPIAVVIPYAEYVTKFSHEPTIPDGVARRVLLEKSSLIRAWREYLGLSQDEMAVRMNITQPAYQQIESKTAKPRPATLQKLAKALGVDERQLYL